jgi:hypothetical protein
MRLIAILICTGFVGCKSPQQHEIIAHVTTVFRNDQYYSATTYHDRSADRMIGAVLVTPTHKRPPSATVPLSKDGRAYMVLYPKGDPAGVFTGQQSLYEAKPGEMVLYSYEEDSFTSLGIISKRAPFANAQSQIEDVLNKLIRTGRMPEQISEPIPNGS